ncbi:MAG: UDP-3-O-(3-hydroxymyristoyl)glucosamine N-acyltransferase [Terriglobia bacterium]
MRLGEIAERTNCSLDGDGSLEIDGVATLEDALPGKLSFLSNVKYQGKLKQTRASAVIVSKDFDSSLSISKLRTDNPYLAFARSIDLFYSPPRQRQGIHPTAIIAKSARIGLNPSIGPYCFLDEEVTLGDHAILHSHVVIYRGAEIGNQFLCHSQVSIREYTKIGNRVILQNHVTLGADGFGFAKGGGESYQKITQSGRVVIGDDVEVQAGATIDRAAIGETRIENGVKIDNLVQVGHGSRVGENTLLCSQVGLAGSTIVGRNVILTGQVGVAGHCHVGDGVIATAQTGIPSDVPAGTMVSGYPAIENKNWLKSSVLFAKLPELHKTLTQIQKDLATLKNRR